MTRAGCLLAIVLLAGTGTGATAWAGTADQIGVTFALMVSEFSKAFAPVEGVIVDVPGGGMVYVDIGAQHGARQGQEFTVFRRDGVFVHPITGKPLGHYEDLLGWAEIVRTFPQYSEARFIPTANAPPPRVADGVRITRGRIRVAITPPLDLSNSGADLRRVPYLLASSLEQSKRFLVVDPLAVADMFASGSVRVEEFLARPERAVGIAKNLDVAGWLVPVLLERAGIRYLDVTWISAVTGTALFSRRERLLPPGEVEEQRFPWEPRPAD